MGQTEKSGWSPPTSVVPLKADIQRAVRQVRFVPTAEVAPLFDHLVTNGRAPATVIRAARLAAILLRIARGLRHAE